MAESANKWQSREEEERVRVRCKQTLSQKKSGKINKKDLTAMTLLIMIEAFRAVSESSKTSAGVLEHACYRCRGSRH